MPVFPKIIRPFEDELLYSYLRRLAIECGEPSYYRFLNHWLRGTQRKLRDDSTLNRYDTAFDLSGLFRAMLNVSDAYPIEFYMNHSVYSFCAPLWADYQKADWVLTQFRPDTELIPHVHSDLVNHLRYCPVCMKEERERGEARYYHLSHNLPGVTSCWKHRVKLMKFDQKAGTEMEAPLSEETELCSEWENRYAVFANDLSKAGINGNLNSTAAAIRDKINELVNQNDSNDTVVHNPENVPKNFREAIKRVKNLNGFTLKNYMEKLTGLNVDIDVASDAVSLRKDAGEFQNRYNPEKTLSVIMCLFRDIEEFNGYVHYSTPEEPFNEMIRKRSFEMISAYHPQLLILQHDWHKPFISAPELIVNGWGCPECEGRLTSQELFRNIFETQKGDEYELLSEFEGYGKTVKVRHNECGREYTQKPVKLIKRNVPCKCHLDVNNIERASKWLEDHYPEFEIISFTDMNAPVTLFCNDCGNASLYPDFYYFMEHPRCKHCNPYTYNKERIEDLIKDLVGDEYTLVTPFTYMKDNSAIFLHNICGTEFSCSPERFTRGIRCHKCKSRMSVPELNTYLRTITGNTYEIIGRGEKTPDLCTVRNNKTGEVQELHKNIILQELRRPTPSNILEMEQNAPAGISRPLSDLLDEYMEEHPAFLKHSFKDYCGASAGDNFDGEFSSFLLKHRIKPVSKTADIYMDYKSNLGVMEIIEQTLLYDDKSNRIGYFTGNTFLSRLRNDSYDGTITLVSNEFTGKYKAHITILGRRIQVSEPQYGEITEDSWKSMCLLSWTISTVYSADLVPFVLSFMKNMRIDEETIELWSKKIHPRIFGRFRKIIGMRETK